MKDHTRFGLIIILFTIAVGLFAQVTIIMFGDYVNNKLCERSYPIGSFMYMKCSWMR